MYLYYTDLLKTFHPYSVQKCSYACCFPATAVYVISLVGLLSTLIYLLIPSAIFGIYCIGEHWYISVVFNCRVNKNPKIIIPILYEHNLYVVLLFPVT
jgi:hypothetical protein